MRLYFPLFCGEMMSIWVWVRYRGNILFYYEERVLSIWASFLLTPSALPIPYKQVGYREQAFYVTYWCYDQPIIILIGVDVRLLEYTG
jgi:hypothetical protein